MRKNSKRYREISKNAVKNKKIDVKEAIDLVKKNSTTKFDESIDLSLKINLKQSKGGDFSLRTIVNLPNGSGKKHKVAVLCEAEKIDEAKKAGADMVGLDDYIKKIKDGWTDVDVIITMPSVMGKLGPLGKILGPRGLMPNPKTGTVTMNVGKAVQEVKAGKIDFKVDKNGIIHVSIGKISFDANKIKENASEVLNHLVKIKPSSSKGVYLKSISMSSTMSPGIKIDTNTI